MEVIDLAKLPNEATMDATGCFALGEGMGDISTERAMIRVLGISCVKGDGVAVDLPTKGVLTGEDGKVGMRGRMVIRESAMLARALLTGFVSGVARAFMPFQAGFFVAPSLGQALEPPPPSNVALAGAAGGMQRAAELLAKHYAQMAARIYPVIEVDAGRWGDLIVTEGRELKEGLK
jgi:conjugal transfer pilus assembly protein TraB